MFLLIVCWLIFCSFSFGVFAFVYFSIRRAAGKPWQIRVSESYKPTVSILVPTYNESSIIRLKLDNLVKIKYPRNLTQIIIVDSNSEDETVNIVKDFVKQHPEINIQVLVENERKGKSAALNFALKHCEGNIIIVSDADCFWPPDILNKAMPYLADPKVGAVSGGKMLLNPEQTWVTRTENSYLNSLNLRRLGESKIFSTLFFEGGFSAFKKQVIEAFDPYETGSDDNGTVIKVIETNSRALYVPEAKFFTVFPTSWTGKIAVKTRRANQLIRVFVKYAAMLLKNRMKTSKRVIIQDVITHLVSPMMFILLSITTILLLLEFPYLLLVFIIFLIPKAGSQLFEIIQSCLILFLATVSVAIGKKFLAWNKTQDGPLPTEEILRQNMLI